MGEGAVDVTPERTPSGLPSRPLVQQLAALSPYARLDDPVAARRLGRPLDDPSELIDHVARQLGTLDRMVVASVGSQTVTARAAAGVALANEVLGVWVRPSFETLRWRVADDQVRIGFTELVEAPRRPWALLVDSFVADLVDPLVEAMRTRVRVARRLLWGNAAAAMLAAVEGVAAAAPRSPPEARRMADDVLDRLPVRGLAVVASSPGAFTYHRQTCCLIFKVPGYGRCGQCSLDRPEARA